MAISGSFTALSAGLISLVALPALLMLLGPRVDSLAPKRWRHRAVDTESGFWYRLSHGVMRRPLIVAVTTAAVLIAAGIPFTRIQFTGVDASVLPDSAAAKQVDTALRTQFPPGRTAPLHVAVAAPRTSAGDVRTYAGRLRALDGVAAVDPPRFVGADTWLVSVAPVGAALDEEALDLVRAVRAGPAPGAVRVAGESARFVDQRAGLADRLPLAIAVLAITTLLILFVNDRLRRAAVQGAADERARHQRRVRAARARLPGRPPGGAARLHEPGRAGDHAAARAAGDRLRAEHRLRRLFAHAHQGGARRRRDEQRKRSRSASSAPGAS